MLSFRGTAIMEQFRVPAWKRLGLKLKYAKDIEIAPPFHDASSKPTQDGGAVADISTNGMDGLSSSKRPSKKRRVEDNPKNTPTVITNGLTRMSSLKGSGSGVRKRVSFTPETKEDDGESSNFMQEKWDEEARNDQINDFLAREAEAANKAVSSHNAPNGVLDSSEKAVKAKKPKREKNPKRTSVHESGAASAQRPSKTSRKSADALEYLEHYQNSRSAWKFNKNREVWLLKHALSVDDVPSTYESALSEYIRGMKSEKSKTRLLDQCHDCIVAEVETKSDESDRALMSKSLYMDTTQRRLTYYDAARQRFRKAHESYTSGEESEEDQGKTKTRYERVDRACKLLETMLSSEPLNFSGTDAVVKSPLAEENARRPPTLNGIEQQPAPKKKKNRTAVVDISSSGEDSSSDSSNDDSTGDSSE